MEANDFEQLKAGDPAAFDRVYRKYSARTLSRFVARTGDVQTSQDLNQELWIRIHQRAYQLEGSTEGQFMAWTRTIAWRLALDTYRDASGEPEGESLSSPGVAPFTRAALRENAERMVHALDALSERDRDVLLAIFQDCLPYAEAARKLGLNEGALRTSIHRALKRYAGALQTIGSLTATAMEPPDLGRALTCAFSLTSVAP
jgi:RNA polymerase sigma-70 factor (ECF subfamily)